MNRTRRPLRDHTACVAHTQIVALLRESRGDLERIEALLAALLRADAQLSLPLEPATPHSEETRHDG